MRPALQLVALAGLLVKASSGVSVLAVQPAVPDDLPPVPFLALLPWWLSSLAWLAAFLALVWHLRRLAVALAAVAVVPMAVTYVRTMLESAGYGALSVGLLGPYQLLLDIALVWTLTAFDRDRPGPARRVPWLVGFVGGSALSVALDLALRAGLLPPATYPMLIWPSLASLAVLGAALVYLFARGAWTPARTRALIVLTAAVLGLRVASLIDLTLLLHRTIGSLYVLVGLVECAALLASGGWLTSISRSPRPTLPSSSS
jgi:hypothetical protein